MAQEIRTVEQQTPATRESAGKPVSAHRRGRYFCRRPTSMKPRTASSCLRRCPEFLRKGSISASNGAS